MTRQSKEFYILNDTFYSLIFVWNITDDKSFSVYWRRYCAASFMPFWALILHATAGWTLHTWKINQINASRGHARAWRHMNICASHPVWDPIGSVQAHTDGPRWSWCRGPALISHRRYLSVRLCPSKAASSFSSTPLPPFICLPSSDSSVQFPHTPFTWPHALPIPSPPCGSASLISSRSTSFCHFKVENCDILFLQGPEYYKILRSKLKNPLSALPFFRPLISLYGSIWSAPPRALHPCVPSGPLYHAGALGLRAN